MISRRSTPQKPRPAGSLKAATELLVGDVGGLGPAAELCGRGKSTVARYTDHAEPDTYMPVNLVRILERTAGTARITAFLAHEAGFRLEPIDPASPAAALAEQVASLAREAGDVIAVSAVALSDGRVTPAEAGGIVKEIDDVFATLERMRAAMRDIAEGG